MKKILIAVLNLMWYAAQAQDWTHYTTDNAIYSIAVKNDTIFASSTGGLIKTHPSLKLPVIYTRLTPNFDSYTNHVYGVYLLPSGKLAMNKGTDSYIYHNGAFSKDTLPYFSPAVTDKNGNVWIGKQSGGISKYDGQSIIEFSNTIPVQDIAANIEGDSIWVLAYQELYLLSNNVLTIKLEYKNFPANVTGLILVEVDKTGRPWIVVEEVVNPDDPDQSYTTDALYCLEKNEWTKVGLLGDIQELEKDPNGSVWVSTYSSLIRYSDINSKQTYPYDTLMMRDFKTVSMHAYRNGVLLGGERNGLYLFENGSFNKLPSSNSGLPDPLIGAILFDKDGTAWINAVRGLVKFDGIKWTTYDQYNSIIEDPSISGIVLDKSGVLWIATEKGLYTYSNNTFEKKATFLKAIKGIEVDKNGSIWLASDNLMKFSKGSLDEYPWQSFNEKENIQDIAVDSSNNVWITLYGNGLRKFDGKNFTDYSQNLPSKYLGAVNVDQKGNLWVGSLDAGITIFDGNAWRSLNSIYPEITEAEGGFVFEGENIWIPTKGGMFKIENEQLVFYTSDNFKLPSSSVNVVAKDKNGNLWFGTSNGLGILNEGIPTSLNDSFSGSITSNFVYPNPVSEYFSIALTSTSTEGKRKVEVLNTQGSVIYSNELLGSVDRLIINAADWKSGMYYYRIYSANSIETGKIVRQ